MMNLSSLSKARIAAFATAAVLVAHLVYRAVALENSAGDYAFGAALVFLALVAAFFIDRSVRVLARYAAAIERIGKGDFESRITGITEKGELATLAVQLNRVVDLTDSFVREVGHSMEQVAEGKYYRKVLERGMPFAYHRSASALNAVTRSTETKVGRFIKHTASFEKSVDGIIKGLTVESINLRNAAEKMTDVADETSQRSDNSSKASLQSTGNVQNVASAAEELAASISEISRQVNDSSTQTAAAAEQAAETDKLVRGLNDAAQKVGSVVQLINEIAAQTNLLALNATIEAARAGEAGKGFAVVANEVKNLATQTTKATEEIVQQISTMQTATNQAVAAVQNIGTRISHVNEISGAIAGAVSEQKIATQEIARNIQQAAASTDEVTNDIAQVSAAAQETRKAAGQVQNTAEEFAKQSQVLNQEIRDFIAVVRDTR